MKLFRTIFLFVLLLYMLPSCKHILTTEKERPIISDSLATMLDIDTVEPEPVSYELKVTGQIDYDDDKVVKIYSFSSGQVVDVLVNLGDKVEAGQTLAILKSADVAGNYQDLISANNDLAIAKKQYENAQSLYNNGIASEREYLEAKENYNKAMANMEKIRGSIDINGKGNTMENGTYYIKAPKSGYIVEKKILEGGFIRSDNSDNLFTIGDIKHVLAWANIYETDIAKVHEGDTVFVSTLAYEGKIFTGLVSTLNEQLDPVSKVMKIRIHLENENRLLKPEMFASIRIASHTKEESLTVSDKCLIFENGKTFVVVYHDNSHVEVKEIQVAHSYNGKTYIKSGLNAGDKVIAKYQLLIFDELTDN